MAKHSSKSVAGSNGGKSGSKVLGVTKDGVRILRQGAATHFTARELRNAVEAVRAAKNAG